MEQALKEYLAKYKIEYKVYNHPPIFTVEESKKLKLKLPGVMHTKNLFLKDENSQFFLVSMYADKRLNLKSLKERVNAKKKLSFASPIELKEHLSLTPGSVSIFGMIHAKSVTLILDRKLFNAKKVGFHPNINTATLELTHENLERFYNSLKVDKYVLDLD